MLGDTAIVVNPNDERYKDVIGKNVTLPIVGKTLPILADEYVDMEFGSGAMKTCSSNFNITILICIRIFEMIKLTLYIFMNNFDVR